MNLLKINTSIGPIQALNVSAAQALVREVIDNDCYRMRRLAKVFTPIVFHDLGINIGDASLLARHLWPDVKIVGFDESYDIINVARANVPEAVLVTASVGYDLKGTDLVSIYGWPDLLKIDIEDGEIPFFYRLYRNEMLGGFRVIVGEWHGIAGRDLLQTLLTPLFDVEFRRVASNPCDVFFAVRKDQPAEVKEALL